MDNIVIANINPMEIQNVVAVHRNQVENLEEQENLIGQLTLNVSDNFDKTESKYWDHFSIQDIISLMKEDGASEKETKKKNGKIYVSRNALLANSTLPFYKKKNIPVQKTKMPEAPGKTKTKLNVLDLFAGAGGMSTGFKMTGFDIKVANEIDKSACQTHRYNHPKCYMIEGGIQNPEVKKKIIEESKKRDVNVIVGGPPCKGFSNSGDKDPRDTRSKLYIDYLDVVKEVQPDVFVIENVPGIATMKIFPVLSDDDKKKHKTDLDLFDKLQNLKNLNGTKKDKGKKTELTPDQTKNYNIVKKKLLENLCVNALDDIIVRSTKMGYSIVHRQVLEAQNYNVPQRRKRMIVIGIKQKNKINELKIVKSDSIKTVKDAIDDLKDILEDEKFSHTFRVYNDISIPEKILACEYGKSYTGNYSESNNKCHPDKPSNTVKENHGAVMTHYEKGRHLTTRELARLQTFPDEFIFPCSKGKANAQIGNAVPCLMAKAIAESIKHFLISPSVYLGYFLSNGYTKVISREDIRKHHMIDWCGNGKGDRFCGGAFWQTNIYGGNRKKPLI